MKRILLACIVIIGTMAAKAQGTYYWVGNPGDSINVGSNWNTDISGSGSSRSSNTNAADILVFDGTNLGTLPGGFTVTSSGGISCAQLKFVNNATINMTRISSGTTTVTIAGAAGEDFVIDAGSSLTIPPSTIGSIRFAMAAVNTGRVSGALAMITPLQARIDNTTGGTQGSLVFTSGSSFTTNITAASASYGFGNSTQSSEKWVVFESGSHLYYEGGFSPHGSGSLFSAIDMKPGSTWHHRATNVISGAGNFFNRKNFGHVSVENNATLNAQSTIYSIGNLTINAGSSFVPAANGQTVVLGNLVANGNYENSAAGTDTLVLGGSDIQDISGAGVVAVGGLYVNDGADVVLNRNINVDNDIRIYGKINFNAHQLNGGADFTAASVASAPSKPGNTSAGRYFIGPVSGLTAAYLGLSVTGTGLQPNTTVVAFSANMDTIYLSKPALSTAAGNVYTFTSGNATLATANPNGFDPVSGSVAVTGTRTYQDMLNYVINAPTTQPFGISAANTATRIIAADVTFNTAVTTNIGAWVLGNLQLNAGKVTIRPLDTIYAAATNLSGSFNSSNYFVTSANTSTGTQGILQISGINSSTIVPVGSAGNYLPVTITPTGFSEYAVAVFEGITENGAPHGTALTANQKLTKVDAVWNINRVGGSGNADLQLQWTPALEGSAFATFADTEIGIITNQPPNWSLPTGSGNNTTNVASSTFGSFGAFSVGAQPPAQAFIFNPLPDKTYGNPDFDPGAISLNTTQPIVYTSSNPAVATIVNGNIHITGTGTTDITATQASDGFYPAANVTQTLTVNKAPLTIKADDKTKPQGDPNPALTITYTGFVNGENSSMLTTPVTIATTAVTASAPGTYPITVSGATAVNYTISFENGTLTVTPRQNQTITFNNIPTKTYGNADFAAGATSTNNTIPITYTSSNPAVATIVGNNIHIVGAGTATITASQAGNGFFFPASPVSRTLTVNRANLTVRALDTIKAQGTPNPDFTITYTGFVLGENATSLATAPTASTTATTASTAGYYPITVSGGVSSNYNFNYINGRLTVLPGSGKEQPYVQAFMSNSSTLTVRLYAPAPDLGDVTIYDMNGKIVMRKNVFMAQGFLDYTFDMRVPASGIYIIHIIGKNFQLKTRIGILK